MSRFRQVAVLLSAAAFIGPAWAASDPENEVPDFSGVWSHTWKLPGAFDATTHGPAPIGEHPMHPHRDNGPWAADWTNPILQPHTREQLKAITEGELGENPHDEASTKCLPPGVPSILGMRDFMQVLQGKNKVWIIYSRDHHVRHVYLNAKHSSDTKRTWLGDSVGHYEGDTLVIDTIGQNDKTETDRFGTPHSDKIHVIERYRLSADGKQLDVDFKVSDPSAFTTEWAAHVGYVRDKAFFEENACAENNGGHGIRQEIAMPIAEKPDF